MSLAVVETTRRLPGFEDGITGSSGAKQWVDHIRRKGNEANHEIGIVK
jgi:hypothetical protein